jgi:hypothetical protein
MFGVDIVVSVDIVSNVSVFEFTNCTTPSAEIGRLDGYISGIRIPLQ